MSETEQKTESQPSRAVGLARELQAEKKRLQEELDALQQDYDHIKPATPTGTVDWFVKWFAVIMAVVGVFLISANLVMYGQILYVLSALAWIYVGMSWGDRAIMIGSSFSACAVLMNLVQSWTI